jgi:hypothetical protein
MAVATMETWRVIPLGTMLEDHHEGDGPEAIILRLAEAMLPVFMMSHIAFLLGPIERHYLTVSMDRRRALYFVVFYSPAGITMRWRELTTPGGSPDSEPVN